MIKNWLLKHLLNAITTSDVITSNGKQLFINKELIDEGELKAIVEEVKFIKTTRIWTLLQGTLAVEAKDRIFNHSKSVDDLIFGKAMLYNLDIQNKIFNIIEKFK